MDATTFLAAVYAAISGLEQPILVLLGLGFAFMLLSWLLWALLGAFWRLGRGL